MQNFGMQSLFQPLQLNNLTLSNRIVMPAMTRAMAPEHRVTADMVNYYAARAQGGVGLIITEGTYVNATAGQAGDDGVSLRHIPNFYGDEALAAWRPVVAAVHAAGAKIFPQLWHVGSVRQQGLVPNPDQAGLAPSAVVHPIAAKQQAGVAMTQADIDSVIDDFATAALAAQRLGFDGIELHAAHGYLLDQFFWSATNKRSDRYGGQTPAQRTHFVCEVIQAIRERVGKDFPMSLRFSQWKLGDYQARLVQTPQQLASFLSPLVDAGVDIFHCSTRRFYQAEFDDSALNLAGLD